MKIHVYRMRECSEDLLVELSEILFNELAFFRLMQDLDGPKKRTKQQLREWRQVKNTQCSYIWLIWLWQIMPIESQILVCPCVCRLSSGQSFWCSKFKFWTNVNTCNMYMHIYLLVIVVVGLHLVAILIFLTFMPITL